ncbi:MAG: NAD(P)-binding protein, partial [Candidatus Aenigmarchaeota archaeon]|nr:NAD(P)-binding protein [Candidatus Aenigmarchaeota archaeon]
MATLILGGGIAGLSLASFLQGRSVILEKEKQLGGLSRSFKLNGISYDIGPHIMFSKNQEILKLHTSMIATNQLKRSNKVFYKGRLVKYPFENELAALPPADRDYCLQEFLNNPYENYQATNMLQFFLKTFGEGITRLYLQPYNEKIWKFDPACMDLQ